MLWSVRPIIVGSVANPSTRLILARGQVMAGSPNFRRTCVRCVYRVGLEA
jgi:hypothetical protein